MSANPARAPSPAARPARHRPAGGKPALRAWLRLLSCANQVEGVVRRNLRSEFGTTLPRFDVLAQLERVPRGLGMGELSRRLMVSNGNVTGVVARLERDGWVRRAPSPEDRRRQTARLTSAGLRAFRAMAARHERWIAEQFSGLSPAELRQLLELTGRLRGGLAPNGGSAGSQAEGKSRRGQGGAAR